MPEPPLGQFLAFAFYSLEGNTLRAAAQETF